jgi:hypothetical protein
MWGQFGRRTARGIGLAFVVAVGIYLVLRTLAGVL